MTLRRRRVNSKAILYHKQKAKKAGLSLLFLKPNFDPD